MRDSVTLSELDLELINALQIRPRASWAALGGVLGVDPATVARRWARLEESGTAWVTCVPMLAGTVRGAYIEIDAVMPAQDAVVDELCADPRVVTVVRTTGSTSIATTVLAPDVSGVSRFVLDRLSALPGITTVRTHLLTGLFTHGSKWRLRSLSPGQQTMLDGRDVPDRDPHRQTDELDRALVVALGENGRLPVATLAERVGASAATVRRRLTTLIDSGQVALRCDMADAATNWPVTASIRGRIRPDRLETTAHAIGRMPELRLCAAVSGRENLLLYLRLRDVDELPAVEARIVAAHPELMIIDRVVVLATAKLMGRRLDREGRSVGTVPMDIWTGHAAALP